MQGIDKFLNEVKNKGFLRIINEKLDVNLEIPHIAFVEAKKHNPSVLLFKNPVDRLRGVEYNIPVLMNCYANFEVTKLIFGSHPDDIAKRLDKFLHFKSPDSFYEKLKLIKKIIILKNLFPKKVNIRGKCQEIVLTESVSLDFIPILKMWENDASKYITAGQVYIKDKNTGIQNAGLYRLQKISKNRLIIHWQLHKDGRRLFNYYKNERKKMPVSIAIGGDPLYLWCAQAPFPPNFFELMFYGFIKNKRCVLVKSITNNIYVPYDADIVIEGEINPDNLADEGPFGDHTGFYTPVERFPILEVKAITMKKKPVYISTVVGKPPCEDKYLGWATERIFLPFVKLNIPEIIDYHMPEAGVFHNLMIVKIDNSSHGVVYKVANALWGLGQMSFLKHVIFVGKDAPELTDYKDLAKYIIRRIKFSSFFISKGIVDQLDHSSYDSYTGGKLAIDATGDVEKNNIEIIEDYLLKENIKKIFKNIIDLKQIFIDKYYPICVIKIHKTKPVRQIFPELKRLKKFLKFVIIVDEKAHDWENLYLLVWRVTNNIDAYFDIYVDEIVLIDATEKNELDEYYKKWPEEVLLNRNVLNNLQEKGILKIWKDLNYY